LEDHKEEILLLAHGYRNLAEMKSWMAKKGNWTLTGTPLNLRHRLRSN
jgi:hypothetical protein